MISPGNILVIDDEESFFEMYRSVLAADGYRVEWAKDGKRGAQRALNESWDVIILDQRLRGAAGGDDGIDLLAALAPTGAKVLVATGFADATMIQRAFADGAYDYLEKTPALATLLPIKVRHAVELVRERRIASMNDSAREAAIRDAWKRVERETDAQRKGRVLEDLMVLLFKTVRGFAHVETRRSSEDEELDVFLRNESTDPFWMKEASQYVIAECKNWSKPVGPSELVVFRDKIANRAGRCKLGFFVAAGGFTQGFDTRGETFRKDEHLVVPIDRDQLDALVHAADRSEALKKLHAKAVLTGHG